MNFLIFCSFIGLAVAAGIDLLPPPTNVKFIFVGFRHGNRNAAQPLKNDVSYKIWAWEGAGQQTNIGKRQAYALGQWLRLRYGDLIPEEYTAPKIKAYSPSAGCLITMQVALAGLFPPKGRAVWNPALLWTPMPVEHSDPMLRMALVKCPRFSDINKPIADDSDQNAQQWLKKDPELVDYISKNSGLNPNLGDLADVADNIMNMKLQNVPLPDWVSKPTLAGYPPKDMFAEVTSFAEARGVVCANNSSCARISAGFWLDNIIQTVLQVKTGTLKDRVANFYAAHTETVLSLIRLIQADGVGFTPPTAGFVLEYTDTPAPAVRFLFHEPDPQNSETIHKASIKSLPFCAGQDWCPLDTFIQNVQKNSFSDWQGECGLPKCP